MGLQRRFQAGMGFKEKGRLPFVTGQCRTLRDHVGQKGVKGLLQAGHKEVPCGFRLRTGDNGDTTDGSGNLRRPAWLSMDYWEGPGEVSCGLLFLSFFPFSFLF